MKGIRNDARTGRQVCVLGGEIANIREYHGNGGLRARGRLTRMVQDIHIMRAMTDAVEAPGANGSATIIWSCAGPHATRRGWRGKKD